MTEMLSNVLIESKRTLFPPPPIPFICSSQVWSFKPPPFPPAGRRCLRPPLGRGLKRGTFFPFPLHGGLSILTACVVWSILNGGWRTTSSYPAALCRPCLGPGSPDVSPWARLWAPSWHRRQKWRYEADGPGKNDTLHNTATKNAVRVPETVINWHFSVNYYAHFYYAKSSETTLDLLFQIWGLKGFLFWKI